MDQVQVGMRVVDRSGQELGTVEAFKAGDPQAVTSAGQEMGGDGGLLGHVASAFGAGPEVPAQAAERMLRVGYLKIDRTGFLEGHAYVEADRLERVEDGAVHLRAGAEELIPG